MSRRRRPTGVWPAALALLTLAAECTTLPSPSPEPRLDATAPPATPASLTVPASTALPQVTATPAPSATPAPPTATPEGQIGPDYYPPDVNPLTGEQVSDPAVLERRPIAVKVSNYPACVRPQDGLASADLVFEHYAEGGATRFTAVFLGRDARAVGSIRSARLIDVEIPAMYRAMLALSGASDGVLNRLKSSDFSERLLMPGLEVGCPPFCRRPINAVPCQELEHTLFTATAWLWQATEAAGLNGRQDLRGLTFNLTPPPGGQPGPLVTVAYTASYVVWGYSETAGRYVRYQDGFVHRDRLTGEPLTAANVIVLFANHVSTDILENRFGAYSTEIQLWGSGPALLFRDGQRYGGTWVRHRREDALTLTDAAGQVLPLGPGPTWYQIVGLTSDSQAGDGDGWKIRAVATPEPTSAP